MVSGDDMFFFQAATVRTVMKEDWGCSDDV